MKQTRLMQGTRSGQQHTMDAGKNTLPFSWLMLLGALTALAPLSIDMYLPALPVIEQNLGAETGSTSLTLAVFFIGMAGGQLFYGPLSDRFGRNKPLCAGLVLYIAASIGCALANNLQTLVVFRFLQALGGCAGPVIARAIVRDRCNAQTSARVFSMLMLVMGLAPILAPVAGSTLLSLTSWRGLFIALALFGGACGGAICLWLPETHNTQHSERLQLGKIVCAYASLLRNRGFLGYTLSSGFGMGGLFAYITASPFILIDHYQLSPQSYSIIFGINALALIAASQWNARLLQHTALSILLRRALWIPASAGCALVVLAFIPATPWWLLCCGFFAFLGGLGFINPNASAAALATHGQQAGMVSALMGSLQFAVATAASILVSLSHSGSSMPLATIMAVCGICAWLAHHMLTKPHSMHH